MQINKGDIFIHYKNKRRYKVVALGQLESDLTAMAIYMDVTDPTCNNCMPIWIRPIFEFSDEVIDPVTNELTTRFVKIKR